MNRIILIGNGFDLSHGLPTKYEDFMRSFWMEFCTQIKGCNMLIHQTPLVDFGYTNIGYYRFCRIQNKSQQDTLFYQEPNHNGYKMSK